MPAKISPTSPRGTMPTATETPVEPALQHAGGADHLPHDGGEREQRREAQHARPGEGREVDPHPHQHEEDRHQEAGDRVDQLLDPCASSARRGRGSGRRRGSARRRRRRRWWRGRCGRRARRAGSRRRARARAASPARAGPPPAGRPGGESQPPIRIAPTRKATALATMAKASTACERCRRVFAAPMMPETTERITRPSTSSITAAPRMIFDSRAASLPRSAEHARRDADAGGGQGGAEEDVRQRLLPGQQPGRDPPAEEERRDHPEHGDQQARPPHREHLGDVRFEPDLEQQQDHAELGEDLDPRRRPQERRGRRTRTAPGCRAACRTRARRARPAAPPARRSPADLGGGEDHHQPEQHRHHRPAMPGAVRRLGRIGHRRRAPGRVPGSGE